MEPNHKSFGESNFATAELGDARRTKRMICLADNLLRNPGRTFPERLSGPGDLEALYRMFDAEEVTHEALLKPHRQSLLQILQSSSEVLLVLHDSSELDYTNKRSLQQLGPIGNGGRRGYLAHHSLVVNPGTGETLGLVQQILHVRTAKRKGETAETARQRQSRESRLWLRGVEGLPATRCVVDVCDRGADTFEFLESECRSGRTFVIRSSHSRAARSGHKPLAQRTSLHVYARTLASLGMRTTQLPAKLVTSGGKRSGPKIRTQRQAREARLCISAAPILLQAPARKRGEHGNEPLALWIVRVWEPEPPAGQQALEWFLITNHPVSDLAEALRVVGWYELRWTIEEFHKALKTGLGIEQLQFRHESRLQPAIALLSIVGTQLLRLRDAGRASDSAQRPAVEIVPLAAVCLLSKWRTGREQPQWTVREYYYALGRLGGHQNRKSDGPPGWLVLWRGLSKLHDMLAGASLQISAKSSPWKCA